jgi:hypothetical protein
MFTEINIHIKAVGKVESIAGELISLKEKMANKNIKADELLEVHQDYKVGDGIEFHRVEIYEAVGLKERIVPHEYWVAVLRDDTYFYIISMLTTGRESDFYVWAQNTEAMEVIMKTIGKGPSPRVQKENQDQENMNAPNLSDYYVFDEDLDKE